MNEHDPNCIGFCGVACGLCIHACAPNCRSGGGLADCVHRSCATDRGLAGCWECNDFPCGKGHFAESDDPAWRGICMGSIACIKHYGKAEFLNRAAKRLGNPVDYGNHRYMAPDEAERLFEPPGAGRSS